MEQNFLKRVCYGLCVFFLLLLAACSSNSATTPTGTSIPLQITVTAIPTVSNTAFAATAGNSGPVNQDAHGDNLTTIHSAVDRPVAKFTQTLLNVPPRAKGVVYIQNDSANAQTLVSDTANGFAPFSIAPNASKSLVFHRAGTFQAHLQDYPVSADTTITIIITMPSPD